MPHRIIPTIGHALDGTVIAVSLLVIGAQSIGVHVDASAMIAAFAGLLIAIGRLALYLAQAFKVWAEGKSLLLNSGRNIEEGEIDR